MMFRALQKPPPGWQTSRFKVQRTVYELEAHYYERAEPAGYPARAYRDELSFYSTTLSHHRYRFLAQVSLTFAGISLIESLTDRDLPVSPNPPPK
jgi:hypothetical protein